MEARAPTTVDGRPYKATVIVLAAALALNVWNRNALWTWYTVTGLAALFIIAAIVRHHDLRITPVAAWAVGLTAALHYVGGSLSGVHAVGGINGLYYVLPWWDNLTHTLGAAAVAVAAAEFLRVRAGGLGPVASIVAAVGVATLAGVLVELYEFAGFVLFGTIDQGFYTNNQLDLYYNLLGATVGAVAYIWWTQASGAVTDGP